MKNKLVAAVLAFFLGVFGTHKFYLGQTSSGMWRLGLFLFATMFTMGRFSAFLLPFLALLGVIEGIVLLAMNSSDFDNRYNKEEKPDYRRRDTDFEREKPRPRPVERPRRPIEARQQRPRRPAPKENLFKKSGIEKYKDYDYQGAIQDFTKALEINERDIAVHFNLACAYSLTEKKDKAFFHLDKAVEYGFTDFKKIKSHDAFAFLRIQDEFEAFEKNGFRLASPPPPEDQEPKQLEPPKGNLLDSDSLLEQLQKLGELREKGLLTEEEFAKQKKKLLG